MRIIMIPITSILMLAGCATSSDSHATDNYSALTCVTGSC
jgi:uncharacterized lipoprotein YajG